MRKLVTGLVCIALSMLLLGAGPLLTISSESQVESERSATILAESTVDIIASDIIWTVFSGEEVSDSVTVTSGQPCSLKTVVTNEGTMDATGFVVTMAVDGLPVEEALPVEELAAGESTTLEWKNIIVSSIGEHTATATVDAHDDLIESNQDGAGEANNLRTEGFDVLSAEWTFAVYMDGDNNLEPYGILDFLEMASVGSSDSVSIVVQMDRAPGYSAEYGDWTGAARYLVAPGMTPTEDNAYEQLGEINMAEADSLMEFVTHAFSQFRSTKTCLVVWDHGAGWIGGCCRDESSLNDSLTTHELREALLGATAAIGSPIDIVSFDCCTMGLMEICYACRDVAVVFIASENPTPLEGWAYDLVLDALDANPQITPEEFATTIVELFAVAYEDTIWYVTLSAFRVEDVRTNLLEALSVFADLLCDSDDNNIWNKVQTARTSSVEFELIELVAPYNDCYYIDLHSFASAISKRVTDPAVRAMAENLTVAVENSMIASSVHCDYPIPPPDSFRTIGIFWPDQDVLLEEYSLQDLSVDSTWDELLVEFFAH